MMRRKVVVAALSAVVIGGGAWAVTAGTAQAQPTLCVTLGLAYNDAENRADAALTNWNNTHAPLYYEMYLGFESQRIAIAQNIMANSC
jgi:hypothetical protein